MAFPVLRRGYTAVVLEVHQNKRFHANRNIDFSMDCGIGGKRYMDRAAQRRFRIGDKLISGKLSNIGGKCLLQICGLLFADCAAGGHILNLCCDFHRTVFR